MTATSPSSTRRPSLAVGRRVYKRRRSGRALDSGASRVQRVDSISTQVRVGGDQRQPFELRLRRRAGRRGRGPTPAPAHAAPPRTCGRAPTVSGLRPRLGASLAEVHPGGVSPLARRALLIPRDHGAAATRPSFALPHSRALRRACSRWGRRRRGGAGASSLARRCAVDGNRLLVGQPRRRQQPERAKKESGEEPAEARIVFFRRHVGGERSGCRVHQDHSDNDLPRFHASALPRSGAPSLPVTTKRPRARLRRFLHPACRFDIDAGARRR